MTVNTELTPSPMMVNIAEVGIRAWAGDCDRNEAQRVLRKWQFYPGLCIADRLAVLARFPETIARPERAEDYLPDFTAIAAEVPAELAPPCQWPQCDHWLTPGSTTCPQGAVR